MQNGELPLVSGLACGLAILVAAATARAEEHPGAAPATIIATVDGDEIILANKVFAARWTLHGGGLLRAGVRDQRAAGALPASGPVFRILLADGTEYAANGMRPAARPAVADVPPIAGASRMADRIHGRQVVVPLVSADGKLAATWRAILREGSNYVREEVELLAAGDDLKIREVVWFQEAVPGAKMAGVVDGSPITAGNFFLGYENPMSVNDVAAAGMATCRLNRDAVLRKGEKLTQSFVVGVAPAGQMRRALLDYVERERAHPYRPFLHYNSWYDIAWDGRHFTEEECLQAVRQFGQRFIKPHGVVMDSMVFDDGWDDFRTLWQFHEKLPNGFARVDELCRRYGTRVGVWLSPFGGYGAARAARLEYGRAQGYEINAAGFSLAGPKYYQRFKRECLNMIRKYRVNYFKFDGIAAGVSASGAGPQFILDTEAMRRLMLELREEEPDLFINLTTGSWPSPFWLRYADSVWRQGDDTGFRGKGPAQQRCLTYRDGETYNNIVRRGPLYPLNSLMSGGVVYSRNGDPGRRDFTSAGLKDDIRAYFGSGTCLQELYLQPARLTQQDWKVLAESAKWARANAGVLVDTHWIGGAPNHLEVYGWASWTPRKGIITLRNPNDQPQAFALDVKQAFELPADAPRTFVLKSPWAEDVRRAPLSVEAGKPAAISLRPLEILTLESL